MNKKPYWKMNTAELADATREFDDPNYHPPAVKPTPAERAQLRKWQQKRHVARLRFTVPLQKTIIRQIDAYAADRGLSVSEAVESAWRELMKRKSA